MVGTFRSGNGGAQKLETEDKYVEIQDTESWTQNG